jgi:hypothetical protein
MCWYTLLIHKYTTCVTKFVSNNKYTCIHLTFSLNTIVVCLSFSVLCNDTFNISSCVKKNFEMDQVKSESDYIKICLIIKH